jgi:hypothetical protein
MTTIGGTIAEASRTALSTPVPPEAKTASQVKATTGQPRVRSARDHLICRRSRFLAPHTTNGAIRGQLVAGMVHT